MPPTLDMPPPLPDAVKAQMGPSSPFSGVGNMMMAQGGDKAAASAPDAQGALKAQIGAIKKVLEQVIASSSAGKTFFSRASQLLDQGLAMESQKGPGTPTTPQPAAGSATEGHGETGGMSAPPVAFPG